MSNNIPDVSSVIDINELKLATLNSIPKAVFIARYLPLLIAEEPNNFNARWVQEVSGSVLHEVIMRDDANGFICLIPPLAETILGNPDVGKHLSEEVVVYGLQRDSLKNIAENRLIDALGTPDYRIGLTVEISNRWADVVRLCGFEIPASLTQQQSLQPSVSIEWEEL